MAKPMLVTLPMVLLLLDYWPLRRVDAPAMADLDIGKRCGRLGVLWRLVAEKLPLLALSAACCLTTFWAQAAAIARLDRMPLSSRIANALISYVTYVGQLFYPVKLAVLYPLSSHALATRQVAGALLLLAVVTAGVAVCWRRRPWLLVGWCWYLGMLVPVIGLVQVGEQSMADRYTYLPQIGLLIALVWEANRAIGSWPYRGWLYAVASALVVAVLMGCAWQQASYWRDSETLWTHAIACTERNAVAHNNLGALRAERGRLDEAVVQIEKALEIQPDYADAHDNLGVVLTDQGRIEEAIVHLNKALAANPNLAGAHYNLARALFRRGSVDEAMTHYRKALEINPNYVEALNNYGALLAGRRRLDEAIAHYRKALEIDPAHANARRNLDIVQSQREEIGKTLARRRELLRSHPDDVTLLNEMAWTLATNPNASIRNGAEAVELAGRAVQLSDGREPAVLDTLAAAYAEAGRFSEALQTAREAAKLAAQQNNRSLAESIAAKIPLYEARTAFREMPPSVPRPAQP